MSKEDPRMSNRSTQHTYDSLIWATFALAITFVIATVVLALNGSEQHSAIITALMGLLSGLTGAIALVVRKIDVAQYKIDQQGEKVEQLDTTIRNGGTVRPMVTALRTKEGQAAIEKAARRAQTGKKE